LVSVQGTGKEEGLGGWGRMRGALLSRTNTHHPPSYPQPTITDEGTTVSLALAEMREAGARVPGEGGYI